MVWKKDFDVKLAVLKQTKTNIHGGDPAGHENDSKSNGSLIRIWYKLINETI